MTSFLNRYTTIPVLVDMLVNKRIVLLSPSSWDDRNDSYYLEKYAQESKLRTILACCFSKSGETFHHWKVFSGNSSGVCVEFDGDAILNRIKGIGGVSSKDVEYRTIKTLRMEKPELSRWPFLKRITYRDEREFRVIYTSKTEKVSSYNLNIEIADINRVTLSPWLHESLLDSVKSVIHQIPDCGKLKINRSTLVENNQWKSIID